MSFRDDMFHTTSASGSSVSDPPAIFFADSPHVLCRILSAHIRLVNGGNSGLFQIKACDHPESKRVLKQESGRQARGDTTSAAYSSICEHWREPRNAEWRPQAQFFNSLLSVASLDKPMLWLYDRVVSSAAEAARGDFRRRRTEICGSQQLIFRGVTMPIYESLLLPMPYHLQFFHPV